MSGDKLQYLSGFISEARWKKFLDVIEYRTRHVCVVLEDIYQPHNASAVLRSCDCFGIQDVHIIENRNRYRVNPDVALGSSRWVNMIRYNSQDYNTAECISDLRKAGYRIAAFSPHAERSLEDLSIEHKIALFYGTELKGISGDAGTLCDELVKIPMFGFTESFNISVSVALSLGQLVPRLHCSSIHWKLSEDEKQEVLLGWLRNSIHRVELIEAEFEKNRA